MCNLHRPFEGLWYINHNLLIAKLGVYGFKTDALRYMKRYLTNKKQRVRANKTFSEWERITTGLLQGSILGQYQACTI